MKESIEQLVRAHDPDNLFSVLARSHEQATRAWARPVPSLTKPDEVRQVIMCGMGGSAISGDLAANFLAGELEVPFSVNRAYGLPASAGKGTLVIASSYSGNTEETLSSLEEALRRGCHAVCITNGGAMGTLAGSAGLPVFPLDRDLQPRYALYSSFFTLLKVLQSSGIIRDQSAWAERIAAMLEESAPRHGGEGSAALEYARRLQGKLALVHSAAGLTDGAGSRLKAQLNENAKVHAFHAALPEMNHNEIVGWEGAGDSGAALAAVSFLDRDYHPRILARFRIFHGLLRKIDVDILEIESVYPDRKMRLFDLVYLSDWISYCLALLRGRDPGEIEYIDHMKRELSRHE
jgi:glucose/mannose-6-phosphate isomerase